MDTFIKVPSRAAMVAAHVSVAEERAQPHPHKPTPSFPVRAVAELGSIPDNPVAAGRMEA